MNFCVRSLAPSIKSPYSEVSPVCGALCGQPPQSRAMYNPSFNPGTCMDSYMRPPQGPPPHAMMGHRGMPPPEGMRCHQMPKDPSLEGV